ncbi:MAG: PhoH family protein [Flavobacteriales bacterium]|nr:PhoH family protein [Flavobacteriales bacterium]
MAEKELFIPSIDPIEFFGPNNVKFKFVQSKFPKLKIMTRGNMLKAVGSDDELQRLDDFLSLIFWHIDKYHGITLQQLERIALGEVDASDIQKANGDVLVFGPGGNKITARTPNQKKMVELMSKNDMLFAIGPAGSGKTYTAVALAVKALKDKEVRRIVLTRPAVEAGENLGFLPGDLKEKLDPYLQPLYDALMDMIPYEKLAEYMEKGVIEIAPLAFMRGRTLDKAFVILDEAQNATVTQMKMFLTRMGQQAKFVITGDSTQIDLPRNQPSGLMRSVDLLRGVEGIGVIELTGSDVIRHPLVKRVISAFEKMEAEAQIKKDQFAKRTDSPAN